MCRWLLSHLDRLPSATVNVTHEWIANVLGVRREGVTETAGKLQRVGFIRLHRGRVEVLRREGLEAHTCECYEVMKSELHEHQPDERFTHNAARPSRAAETVHIAAWY